MPLLSCLRPSHDERRWVARDARKAARAGITRPTRAEAVYSAQLQRIAQHVGDLVNAYPLKERGSAELQSLLKVYAHALKPWAGKVAGQMIADVNARDIETWRTLTQHLSRHMKVEIQHTEVGAVMANLAAEQTELIQSLPLKSAERVQRLTVEGLLSGEGYARVQRELARSGEVTAGQARVIARTEVARTASNLTEARARVMGAPYYIWRTQEDDRVRPSHAAMEGQVCRWDDPPELDEGGRLMRFHPGCVWNCRCNAQVILS